MSLAIGALMWIVLLLIVGLLLICAEIVVPGGIVGAIGALMVIGSAILTFMEYGPMVGTVYLFIAAGLTAVALRIMVKALLNTPLGNLVVLKKNLEESKSFEAGQDALLGQSGQALTDLRPAGTAEIRGQRVDVVTEGLFVARGASVKVVAVEGARVVVRPMEQ